jgi:hypothetical protein
MLYKILYIEPMIYYKFATFDNRTLTISESMGGASQTLDRNYNAVGLVLRSGLRIDKNHFRFNFFYGLGYYLRYYKEEIDAITQWGSGTRPLDYPIKSDYWKNRFSLHLGIELGFRF